ADDQLAGGVDVAGDVEDAGQVIARSEGNEAERSLRQVEVPNGQVQRPVAAADDHPVEAGPGTFRRFRRPIRRARTRRDLHVRTERAQPCLRFGRVTPRPSSPGGGIEDELQPHCFCDGCPTNDSDELALTPAAPALATNVVVTEETGCL